MISEPLTFSTAVQSALDRNARHLAVREAMKDVAIGLDSLMCPICQRSFKDKQGLSEHRRRVNCSKTALCRLCAKEFISDHNRSFYCLPCRPVAKKLRDKKYDQSALAKLKRNARVSQPSPQQCASCHKWFAHQRSIAQHLRENYCTANKTKECLTCNEEFNYKHAQTMYCSKCATVKKREWTNLNYLRNHSKGKAVPLPVEIIKCPYCEKEFKSKMSVARHYKGCAYLGNAKSIAAPVNPIKPCVICGAVGFYKKSAYCKNCYKVAAKTEMAQCGICNFIFKGVKNFTRHIAGCRGVKCQRCGINNRPSLKHFYCENCAQEETRYNHRKWKVANPDRVRMFTLKSKQNKTLQELTNFIQRASTHGV